MIKPRTTTDNWRYSMTNWESLISATTLLAAQQMMRKSYGFEVDRNFFNDSINKLLGNYQPDMFQALKYEGKAV